MSSFRGTAKLRGRYRGPLPPHMHRLPSYQHLLQNNAFVTSDEPTPTHHNHPKPLGLWDLPKSPQRQRRKDLIWPRAWNSARYTVGLQSTPQWISSLKAQGSQWYVVLHFPSRVWQVTCMSPSTVCSQHLLLCCYHSLNPLPSSLLSSMNRCQFKRDTDFIYFLLSIVINRLLRKCFQNHLSQWADIYPNIGKRV